MKVHVDGTPYAFALCLTRTGNLTHLGLDCGHPSLAPGHPRQTLCGRLAISLPRGCDPWEGIGAVECRLCLMASPRWMKLPGWPSMAAALACFEKVHLTRAGGST